MLGSEAYQLVTGTSGFHAGFGLIDKNVRNKVSLIEGVIEGYYLNDTDVTLMKEGIYRGIIDSLGDPYSSYYNEEEFNLLMESSSGVFYGVGMYLSQNPDTMEIEVVRPISGSPALEAGIEAGDKILKVDGEDISGMQLTDVVARVKGLSGTKVKLTMLREGEQMEFEVERREIESETVSYEMKEKKTGYIMIAEFDDVTYQQFKDAAC